MWPRILLFISPLVLGVVPAAHASPVAFTETLQNESQTFADVLPCRESLGDYDTTITYNAVFHVTSGFDVPASPIPLYHLTGTSTGRFVAVPRDFSQPTFTGRFTVAFDENRNTESFTTKVTSSWRGTGTDGSAITFHEVVHLSVSASGATLEFDKPTC